MDVDALTGEAVLAPLEADLQERPDPTERRALDGHFSRRLSGLQASSSSGLTSSSSSSRSSSALGSGDAAAPVVVSAEGFPAAIRGFNAGVSFAPASRRPSTQSATSFSDGAAKAAEAAEAAAAAAAARDAAAVADADVYSDSDASDVSEPVQTATHPLSSFEQRRDVVDDAAHHLLAGLTSRDASAAPTAQTLFKVLQEVGGGGGATVAESDSDEEVGEPMDEVGAARFQTRLEQADLRAEAHTKGASDFRGYCFDDAVERGMSEVAFVKMCLGGRLDEVKHALGTFHQSDIERLLSWTDHVGQTALHRLAACVQPSSEGQVAVAEALLDAGADPNARDSTGWTPVFYAVQFGHRALVSALLEAGADLSLRDRGQQFVEREEDKEPSEEVQSMLRQVLVIEGRELAAEDRTLFEWCESVRAPKMLEHILRFTFIHITQPARALRGYQALASGRLPISWSSHTHRGRFNVLLHVVGTRASVSELIRAEASRQARPSGSRRGLRPSDSPKKAEASSWETAEVSVERACEHVTLSLVRSALQQPRPGSSHVSADMAKRFSSLQGDQQGWRAAAFNRGAANFDKLHTVVLAESLEARAMDWDPSDEQLAGLPRDSLVLLEVHSEANAAIRGISDIFPLFPI